MEVGVVGTATQVLIPPSNGGRGWDVFLASDSRQSHQRGGGDVVVCVCVGGGGGGGGLGPTPGGGAPPPPPPRAPLPLFAGFH